MSDEQRCPKCETPRRPGAAACPRCGLLVARWPSFADAPPSQALSEAWRACEAAWEDPASHQRLLDLASHTGELDLVARRYRRVLAQRPDDPAATARLKQIAALVEAAARAQAHGIGSRRTMTGLWIVVYLFAVLLVATSAWVMWVTFNAHKVRP